MVKGMQLTVIPAIRGDDATGRVYEDTQRSCTIDVKSIVKSFKTAVLPHSPDFKTTRHFWHEQARSVNIKKPGEISPYDYGHE